MSQLASSSAVRFRWINGQCFEFRFPNGKTLITDPWYTGGGPLARMCPPDFTIDDLEGGDYIFVNHSHGDHIENLQEVVDRFDSTVITHSAIAMEIARHHHIPLTSIYPVDYEGTYYFDGFILQTYHGTHHAMKKGGRPNPMLKNGDYDSIIESAKEGMLPGNPELNAMGSVFNTNFILTTDQGMRIAFLGGNDDGMLDRMKGVNKPNVVLRNKLAGSVVKEGQAKMFADWLAKADVQLLVPMHYETWLTKEPEFAEDVFSYMNKTMEEMGKVGRVAPMIRGKWYTLDISVTEVQ